MAEKSTALHAIYVIDGVQEEYTPAQLLDAVTEPEGRHTLTAPVEVRAVDETLDPVCRVPALDPGCIDAYLDAVCTTQKQVPASAADVYTRVRLASALIDTLWRTGRFRLGDLRLDASWPCVCMCLQGKHHLENNHLEQWFPNCLFNTIAFLLKQKIPWSHREQAL